MRSRLLVVVCAMAGLQAAAMAQSGWTLMATGGPAASQTNAMAYDSRRGRTVIFGHTAGGETWEWDGVTWAQASTVGPSLVQHAMTYDSQRGRTVMFGPGQSGDTWEWNGSSWTLVSTGGPTSRFHPAMAYDSARGRTVLFGGTAGPSVLGDTWEWDGSTWVQVSAAGPPARYGHSLAYDGRRGRVVLFGGYSLNGNFHADTWEWDGSLWLPQLFASGPVARVFHSMVYDGQRRRVVMYGGQDAARLFGDLWEWDGTAWRPHPSAAGPPARYGHVMAYDSQRGRTVMYGGQDTTGYLGDTWELSSRTASALAYGAGCGSPPLALSQVANAQPTVGTTAEALLTNVPSSVAFVALGLSRTRFGPFPLPLTLAGYGMSGCELLQSAEAAAQPVTFTGAGTAWFRQPLPNNPSLIGLHVYLQGWAFAPGANPGQMIVSNGLDWFIGY